MTATDKTAANPLPGEHEGLFVRKSSGLVRAMGTRDALSVSLGGINPAIGVAIFFVVIAFASNTDLTWPFIVSAVILVPLALTYAQLVASIPRTGGDFVWLSRIFHPALGASVGVGFLLFLLLLFGTNAEAVANYALPEFIRALGVTFHSDALLTFSGTLTGQTGVMVSSVIIILLTCLIGVFGAHALARAMWWCFIAALVGIAVLIVVALTHSAADFRSAYDHAHGAGAYQRVIAGAGHAGVLTGNTFSGFMKVLPFATGAWYGFTAANFPAGELKRPAKAYVRGTLTGIGGAVVVLVTAWLAVKHLAGLHFLQSASGLASGDPAAFGKATSGGAPVVTQYYADLLAGGPLAVVISAGIMLGSLMTPLVCLLNASRLTFALSFDRLLPGPLADVNERTHAPLKAMLFAAVGGLIFTYLTVYSTGFAHALRNSLLIFLAVYTLSSLAGIGLILRRRHLYDASPHVVGGKWLGLPPIVFIAGLSAIVQLVLFYEVASNPAISGGYDAGSVATLVVVAFSGVIVYGVSRLYFRSRGVDLGYAMRELPPE